MIEVCCAIIINEGKMLAVQRGPQSSHPWKWEFPGGKINAFESAEQCIVREIEEELEITVEIMAPLKAIEFDYGTSPLYLIPFVCRIQRGKIILTEHTAMQWIGYQEWESLDWAEADRELILINQEQIKQLLA